MKDYGRAKLKVKMLGTGYYQSDVECLIASDANKIMDAMEADLRAQEHRIKELKLKLESEKIVNAAEIQKNWEHAKRIEELESKLYKPCGVVTNLLNRCNNFVSEDNKAMHLVNDCYREIQSLLERIKELEYENKSAVASYNNMVVIYNQMVKCFSCFKEDFTKAKQLPTEDSSATEKEV